jgi:hypothetical protein
MLLRCSINELKACARRETAKLEADGVAFGDGTGVVALGAGAITLRFPFDIVQLEPACPGR